MYCMHGCRYIQVTPVHNKKVREHNNNGCARARARVCVCVEIWQNSDYEQKVPSYTTNIKQRTKDPKVSAKTYKGTHKPPQQHLRTHVVVKYTGTGKGRDIFKYSPRG